MAESCRELRERVIPEALAHVLHLFYSYACSLEHRCPRASLHDSAVGQGPPCTIDKRFLRLTASAG